mmetsp:Transcript_7840/g.22329  ORF Transcript_7840/g.22329 Transcript_7840/m.22329 type:complete len:229 (+) Transcript_7840:118-804(+)
MPRLIYDRDSNIALSPAFDLRYEEWSLFHGQAIMAVGKALGLWWQVLPAKEAATECTHGHRSKGDVLQQSHSHPGNCVVLKICPHLVKLGLILLGHVCAFENNNVLLIVQHGLPGPVEGAGGHQCAIEHRKLVVHVILLTPIMADRYPLGVQRLDVTTCGIDLLIISDYSDLHASPVAVVHRLCNLVACYGVHSNLKGGLGLLKVFQEPGKGCWDVGICAVPTTAGSP